MKSEIRIALADDHRLIRSGMKSILNSCSDFKVVQEAANGQELLDGLTEAKPDVILLDLEMPVLTGKEALEMIRKESEQIKVLILTMHQSKAFIVQMMELGANGYLVKDCDPEEVIAAIEKVYHHDYYFSEKVSLAMLGGITDPALKATAMLKSHGLNEREVEVLRLICEEKTTPEIGEALFLSPKTIEGYRKSLLEKSGVRNMAGLVLFAVKHGLVEV
ncbi:MAG: response regulator transcription factor [Roseivirga sp.]|nr:response regulator transcription factor [Roseivirga sp.]